MRLIDADAFEVVSLEGVTEEFAEGAKYVLELLDKAPTVEAVPVAHGRWIKDGEVVVCSECGEEHAWDEYRATYCEDCGAKMDGGVDDGGRV